MNNMLPNDQWALSTKVPGWAICFDAGDEANFLRKMQNAGHGWEPRDRLTAEEMVQALGKASLARFHPTVQAPAGQTGAPKGHP